MELNISKSNLQEAVTTAGKAVPRKTVLPVLECLLLDTDGKQLSVLGSNQELTIRATTETEPGTKKGRVLLNAATLLELLPHIPADEILSVSVTGGAANIKWSNGQASIPTFNLEDYPDVLRDEQMPLTITTDAKSLADAIKSVSFAAANDESIKPQFTAIFLGALPAEGKVILVASEGHMMSLNKVPAEISHGEGDSDSAMIPKRSADAIRAFLQNAKDKVTVNIGNTSARFTADGQLLECRTLTGKYLPYEKVIPTDAPNRLSVANADFQDSVNRINIFANRNAPGLLLSIDGLGIASLHSEDTAMKTRGEELVAGSYEGEPVSLTLHGLHLTDILASFGDTNITLSIVSPSKPVLLQPADKDSDRLAVIVPIQPRKAE